MALHRQIRRPKGQPASGVRSGAGIAIDPYGGPVIDPTENVLALVDAESKFQNAIRDAQIQKLTELREAETRRVNDLAELRRHYETRISETDRIQVKTTSELISTQLDKVTTSLSTQITTLTRSFADQISALTDSLSARIADVERTLSARIADVERFRWESGGKTSVSDPALAANMVEMTGAIHALQKTVISTDRQSTGTEARSTGRNDMITWIMMGLFLVVQVGTIVGFFLRSSAH